MARLEYRLTKAYLRYTAGQRYGFVNPNYTFNRIDPLKEDSSGKVTSYRQLYDLDAERIKKSFFSYALNKVYHDSVGWMLQQVLPSDAIYHQLKEQLHHTPRGSSQYMRLLCNMERRRWRVKRHPEPSSKYVLVNIPSYHLIAYSPDGNVLEMKVGCGALQTKTPVLTSDFTRMDVNPHWNIPMSIVEKDIIRHLGDASYFDRRRYFFTDTRTGERVDMHRVSADDLKAHRYRISQEGGEGNALGRIIFRFPNNFSVFLHDTSNRDVFGNDNRGVSHGCVRVERPFDLACFLLDNPDDWTVDKLRISMDMDAETEKGIDYVNRNRDEEGKVKPLVKSLSIHPHIPLFITYYTIYPDLSGELQTYPDVYGYDKVIAEKIKPFMK